MSTQQQPSRNPAATQPQRTARHFVVLQQRALGLDATRNQGRCEARGLQLGVQGPDALHHISNRDTADAPSQASRQPACGRWQGVDDLSHAL